MLTSREEVEDVFSGHERTLVNVLSPAPLQWSATEGVKGARDTVLQAVHRALWGCQDAPPPLTGVLLGPTVRPTGAHSWSHAQLQQFLAGCLMEQVGINVLGHFLAWRGVTAASSLPWTISLSGLRHTACQTRRQSP